MSSFCYFVLLLFCHRSTGLLKQSWIYFSESSVSALSVKLSFTQSVGRWHTIEKDYNFSRFSNMYCVLLIGCFLSAMDITVIVSVKWCTSVLV